MSPSLSGHDDESLLPQGKPDEYHCCANRQPSSTRAGWSRSRSLALGIVASLLVTGTFFSSLYFYSRKETYTCTQKTDSTHPSAANALNQLFEDKYPIQYDPVGAYIACPLDSAAAARKGGCSYDLMINGYIPDPCFDSEMHQDFTTNVELGFWADEAATQPISTAELLEGDMIKHKTAWLSNYAHWQHCMYLINGTHRAYSRMPTLFLDAYLDQPHIQHCFTVIAEPKPTLPYKKMEQPMEAVFISERRCYLRDLSPSVPENPGAVNIAITHAKVLPQLPDFVDEDDNRR